MTYVIFPDFPGLENGLTKFHDWGHPAKLALVFWCWTHVVTKVCAHPRTCQSIWLLVYLHVHHMAQHHPTGSETSPSYAPRSSRFGSEPPSVKDDVDVWRYAIVSCMPETTTTCALWDRLCPKKIFNLNFVNCWNELFRCRVVFVTLIQQCLSKALKTKLSTSLVELFTEDF